MSKEELLELYREFGSEAQEALNFVVKNLPILKVDCDVSELPHDEGRIITIEKPGTISFEKPADGVYIIFKTGQYVPFDKDADYNKEDVTGIGVVYDGHPFQVALEDLGEQPLIKEENNTCPEESPFYKTECEGLHDWDFVSATNHLKECGMDMPLPDGWYIPTLAVLEVMCFLKKQINEALEFAGGKAMPDDYHWSSTEYGRTGARFVYFASGYAYDYVKSYSYVVRAVTAFPLKA